VSGHAVGGCVFWDAVRMQGIQVKERLKAIIDDGLLKWEFDARA
jgi:hypothetical protein